MLFAVEIALLHLAAGGRAVEQLPKTIGIRLEIIGMGNIVQGQRVQLILWVADDGTEGLIGLEQRSIQPDQCHADGGCLKRIAKPLSARVWPDFTRSTIHQPSPKATMPGRNEPSTRARMRSLIKPSIFMIRDRA